MRAFAKSALSGRPYVRDGYLSSCVLKYAPIYSEGAFVVKDRSPSAKTITDGGSNQSRSTSPQFPGPGSRMAEYFSANTIHTDVADSADWNFGTGDFSILFSMCFAAGTAQTVMGQRNAADGGNHFWFVQMNASNQIRIFAKTTVTELDVNATTAVPQTWMDGHSGKFCRIHVRRRAGTIGIAYNEVPQSTTVTTNTGAWPNSSATFQIGDYQSGGTPTGPVLGFLRDIAIYKGVSLEFNRRFARQWPYPMERIPA